MWPHMWMWVRTPCGSMWVRRPHVLMWVRSPISVAVGQEPHKCRCGSGAP